MKHLLIVLCMSFCCVTQFVAQNDNVVYPYGDNVEWRYYLTDGCDGININNYWCTKQWKAIDTLIDNTTYTTQVVSPDDSRGGFIRVDSTTLETYFYSNISNQEYNITTPASLQVGDTIELTNVLLSLENQCNTDYDDIGSYSYAEDIYEDPNLRLFGIVEQIYSETEPLISYKLRGISNQEGWDNWILEYSSSFIPGIGFTEIIFSMCTFSSLSCVVETEENTFFYTNGGCLNSIPEQKQLVTTLFPNPATNKFSVTTISNEPIKVSIFHLNGILVKQIEEHQPSEFISCNELEPGMYIVVIEQNQFVQYLNLIID